MEDQICCPKCGSSNVSANKKGWSLTTGMIGSNKIKITCLKCGKQFKPSEDQASMLAKKQQVAEMNGKIATFFKKKGVLKWAIIILIGLVIIGSIFGKKDTNTATATTPLVDSSVALDSSLQQYYTIEKADIDRPTEKNLCVYISDTSKISSINDLLIQQYNSDKSNYMSVSYFNKKGIGKIYDEKINSDKISDKAADKLFKYFIANYDFNPSNGYEKLSYMH